MDNQLQEIVRNQFMIIVYVKEKLDIVNAIYGGYQNNDRIFYNRFLLFTAHVFYRSIVIDLCALFANNKNAHKQNFHRLYNNQPICSQFKSSRAEQIKLLLTSHSANTDVILKLRDKEYAHYDFQETSIHFNLDNLDILNNLFDTAKAILKICGENEDTSFDLSMGDNTEALGKLLNGSAIPTVFN